MGAQQQARPVMDEAARCADSTCGCPGDRVTAVPPGFSVVGGTDHVPIAAMADEARRWYGVQFHPEVTHTRQGTELLRRFATQVCGCRTLWTAANIIGDAVQRVRAQVALTGCCSVCPAAWTPPSSPPCTRRKDRRPAGCASRRHRPAALDQEGDQVMATMAEHMGVRVIRVDAAQRFFDALRGSTTRGQAQDHRPPVRGDLRERRPLEGIRWLAQGTIYPT